jgi:protein-tyrosine phosphatase
LIDLHCHLLAGIDDGPRSVAESVALAATAAEDGIEIVAATPHAREDHPRVVPAELASRCDELSRALRREHVPTRVVSGAEVDLAWALGASQEDLRAVTYSGRGTDVLVETPYGFLPPGFEDRLHDTFGAKGVRVLLAHPERNGVLQREPERLTWLVKRGVLTQVTAHALTSRSSSGRFARAMVSEGIAHVIATDSHGPRGRGRLSEAVAAVPRGDRDRARWMVTDAPAAILAGEPLPAPPSGRRVLRQRFR